MASRRSLRRSYRWGGVKATPITSDNTGDERITLWDDCAEDLEANTQFADPIAYSDSNPTIRCIVSTSTQVNNFTISDNSSQYTEVTVYLASATTFSDVTSTVASVNSSITERLPIADGLVENYTGVFNTNDSFNILSNLLNAFTEIVYALQDTFSLNSNFNASTDYLDPTATDEVSISDAYLVSPVYSTYRYDSIPLSDGLNASTNISYNYSDSTSYNDSMTIQVYYNDSKSDPVALNDHVYACTTLNISPVDNAMLTDTTLSVLNTVEVRADGFTIADQTLSFYTYLSGQTEAISISDTITVLNYLTITIADTFTLASSVTNLYQTLEAIADRCYIVDAESEIFLNELPPASCRWPFNGSLNPTRGSITLALAGVLNVGYSGESDHYNVLLATTGITTSANPITSDTFTIAVTILPTGPITGSASIWAIGTTTNSPAGVMMKLETTATTLTLSYSDGTAFSTLTTSAPSTTIASTILVRYSKVGTTQAKIRLDLIPSVGVAVYAQNLVASPVTVSSGHLLRTQISANAMVGCIYDLAVWAIYFSDYQVSELTSWGCESTLY